MGELWGENHKSSILVVCTSCLLWFCAFFFCFVCFTYVEPMKVFCFLQLANLLMKLKDSTGLSIYFFVIKAEINMEICLLNEFDNT